MDRRNSVTIYEEYKESLFSRLLGCFHVELNCFGSCLNRKETAGSINLFHFLTDI